MSTTQSCVINLPKILEFLKATVAEKILTEKEINNPDEYHFDANLIKLINNVFKFKGEKLRRWVIAYGNCPHLERSIISDNEDEQYSDDAVRYAFLSFLFFNGNDQILCESFKNMIKDCSDLYPGNRKSEYLDKDEVRPDNVEAVDAIIHVYGNTNGETGKIIAELKSNKFVIDNVSGLFGCDLTRFINEVMKESRLIGFVNRIINKKTEYALAGKRCFHYETLIKALYIQWILDKDIGEMDDRVFYICQFFGTISDFIETGTIQITEMRIEIPGLGPRFDY